jgi:hypothetical protein
VAGEAFPQRVETARTARKAAHQGEIIGFLACPHHVSSVPSGCFWRITDAYSGRIGDVPAGPVEACPRDRR